MPKSDYVRAAKEVIANRRSDSIAEYESHVRELCALSKDFAAIDKELGNIGLRIARTAFAKPASETIDDIKRDSDRLTAQKRMILKALGYPEDYCDINYHCRKCNDNGYIGIDICECLKKEVTLAAMKESGLSSLLDTQSFDTFSLDYYTDQERTMMAQTVDVLKKYADGFVPGKSKSILFVGGTGLGKTHLSTSVARCVLEKGAYVVYESAMSVFTDYENRRFGGGDNASIAKYSEAELLIIDDLGCELTNQFTVSCLYEIINSRINNHSATIINTNLMQADLRKRYTDRIVSRLFGEYMTFLFRGNDIREQKLRRQ